MTAEASEAAVDDSHISFAKRLAHNNKVTRTSALRKLKRWLVTKSKQGTLDHDEIIKIWKGLHYSMWYSDKPLVQEALALDISQIITLIPDVEDSVSFFGGFCETIAREWVLIDKLRLDKFYMFIKTALKCVMEFCADKNWDDQIVSNVVLKIDSTIINSETCPNSIPVFISEHFLALYSEVYTDSTPTLFITKILMAYVNTLSRTPKRDLNKVIMANIFEPITSKSVSFKLDLPMLSVHIHELAVKPDILTRNRKLLYRLRNDLTVAVEGDLSKLSPLGKHSLVNGVIDGLGVIDINSDPIFNSATVSESVPEPKKKKNKAALDTDNTGKDEVERDIDAEAEPQLSTELNDESKVEIMTVEPVSDSGKCKTDVVIETEAEPQLSMEINDESEVEITTVVPVSDSGKCKTEVVIETEAEPQPSTELKDESEVKNPTVEPVNDTTEVESDIVTNGAECSDSIVLDSVPSGELVAELKKKKKKAKPDSIVLDSIVLDSVPSGELVAEPKKKKRKAKPDSIVLDSIVLDSVPSGEIAAEPKKKKRKSKSVAVTEENGVSESNAVAVSLTVQESNSVIGNENLVFDEVEFSSTLPKKSSKSAKKKRKSVEIEAESEKNHSEDLPTHDANRQPVAEAEDIDEETEVFLTTPEPVKSTKASKSDRKKKRKTIEKTPTVVCTPPSRIKTPIDTPAGGCSTAKKKVRLSMENNQTFFFKKNASLESPVPFDSTRTPIRGVLKSSPALTRSQSRQNRGKSRVKRS